MTTSLTQTDSPPPPGATFIDNWTLQEVASALKDGLSPDPASKIQVDSAADNHAWLHQPAAVWQIQSILDLLLDVVLRDALYVGSSFLDTWRASNTLLNSLLESGVLVGTDVPPDDSTFRQRRQVLLNEICATTTLKEVQRQNEESFRATGRSSRPHESALIWGGAGNMSRAVSLSMVYSSHPARRTLFEQTIFAAEPRHDAVRETIDWLHGRRIQLLRDLSPTQDRRFFQADLPPLISEVILSATDAQSLILNAVSARDEYRRLREWLVEYQTALEFSDIDKLSTHRHTLVAVERDIATLIGNKGEGGSYSMTLGSFSIPVPVQRLSDNIFRRFGVRAVFNRLLRSKRNDDALKRLLGIFGERDTQLGSQVVQTFQARGR